MELLEIEGKVLLDYEGKLESIEQEGGYASPTVMIGGNNLTADIEELATTPLQRETHEFEGKYRIVLLKV